jgi:lysophospholipase L1-like esterase
VALGDSTTVGVGDPLLGSALPRTGAGALPGQGWRGWAALLAEALGSSQQVSYRNLATSGATAPAVLHDQLPASGTGRIDVASLVVGVNDTMRSSFDGDRIRDCLLDCADQLSRRGALLLTVRFHDHGQVFGLPGWLRRPLWRRIELVNAAYDEVERQYGGIRVDLGACPEVYLREFWSVDRLHPGERGHRRLARIFADELAAQGIPIAAPPALHCTEAAAPTRWDDALWMIREGVPWLGRRAKDLTPWAVRMAATHLTNRSSQPARRVGDRSSQPALTAAPEPPQAA